MLEPVLSASLFHHADLDRTVLGKPGQGSLSVSPRLYYHKIPGAPSFVSRAGPLAPWDCTGFGPQLGFERELEFREGGENRLLRLRPDHKDEAGWRPVSRLEFMTIAAREALRGEFCE